MKLIAGLFYDSALPSLTVDSWDDCKFNGCIMVVNVYLHRSLAVDVVVKFEGYSFFFNKIRIMTPLFPTVLWCHVSSQGVWLDIFLFVCLHPESFTSVYYCEFCTQSGQRYTQTFIDICRFVFPLGQINWLFLFYSRFLLIVKRCPVKSFGCTGGIHLFGNGRFSVPPYFWAVCIFSALPLVIISIYSI